MTEDFEDVSGFSLSDEREQLLYAKQTECTFMWTNKAGEPIGVIMNYVVRDGSFWLTATRCPVFPKIKCDYPKDADGKLIPKKLGNNDWQNYQGVRGHYNVQL